MTITIGAFSCDNLTAQPFGYEGDAIDGSSSRSFRVTGLLTPTQWSSLLTVYSTWRNTRLNDNDTLYTGTVGTTVSLTITSSNGVSVSGLACWFTSAPAGDQVGAYISVDAVLVDAAQALAVLQRAVTKAAQRQAKQELLDKEAQLTARDTLADDIAAADLDLEDQNATAQSTVYSANTATLESIRAAQANVELLGRQADLAAKAAYAVDLATVDLSLQEQEASARETAYGANTNTLEAIKGAESAIELADKEALLAGKAALAQDIAAVDLSLQAQDATARAAAYAADTTALQQIQASQLTVEKLESAAKVAALTSGTTLNNLRDARALQAVYDKYLGEDLLDLGTVTLGSVTIKLIKPMATFTDGPQVALTAGGVSLITGPLQAHETRRIEGIITNGTLDSLNTWYTTTIANIPAAGAWFPVTPPIGTAEKFLVNGAVATRYSVNLELKKII